MFAPLRHSAWLAVISGVILLSPLLPLLAAQDPAAGPPPAPADQERMLNAMRRFAEHYVSNLPDFLCQQTTYQFQSNKNGKHSHQGDTLTSRLTYTNGREHRTLMLVNDKPLRPGIRSWRTPLTTEGEFGMLLERVFSSGSNADFRWQGWETVRGRRLAVFLFAIDRRHSTLRLSLSDLAEAIVPYYGAVYGDPVSGEIWRISDAATDIPPEVDTRSISTVIDYDYVPIGAKTFLLPSRAVVNLTTDRNQDRNEIEFRDYRKFEANSSITFMSDDEPKNEPNSDRHNPQN